MMFWSLILAVPNVKALAEQFISVAFTIAGDCKLKPLIINYLKNKAITKSIYLCPNSIQNLPVNEAQGAPKGVYHIIGWYAHIWPPQ